MNSSDPPLTALQMLQTQAHVLVEALEISIRSLENCVPKHSGPQMFNSRTVKSDQTQDEPMASHSQDVDDFSIDSETTKFTERDDDEELLRHLFSSIDTDGDSIISSQELLSAIERFEGQRELLGALRGLLASNMQPSETSSEFPKTTEPLISGITFDNFFQAFELLPRVRGERVRWAASLGLEGELARLLAPGSIFDGLRALRLMEGADLEAHITAVCAGFSVVLPRLLRRGLARLRTTSAMESRAGERESDVHTFINSKFVMDGAYTGHFATLDDFYKGPEAHIGAPNPRIHEGMCKEHTTRGNARRRFRTSNYNVETYPALEWDFVVAPQPNTNYPHCPKDPKDWPAGHDWKGEHGREAVSIDELLARPEQALRVRQAGLRRDESISMRLYTGASKCKDPCHLNMLCHNRDRSMRAKLNESHVAKFCFPAGCWQDPCSCSTTRRSGDFRLGMLSTSRTGPAVQQTSMKPRYLS